MYFLIKRQQIGLRNTYARIRMPTLKRRVERVEQRNKPNKKVYQSSRWHSFSLSFRKANRLCVECLKEGKTVLSQCADHIIPIQQGGPIWDESNMQALCLSHHSKKTKEEQQSKRKHEE
jgi:5-methylcytosine-specific restriction endonuclease McrA